VRVETVQQPLPGLVLAFGARQLGFQLGDSASAAFISLPVAASPSTSCRMCRSSKRLLAPAIGVGRLGLVRRCGTRSRSASTVSLARCFRPISPRIDLILSS